MRLVPKYERPLRDKRCVSSTLHLFMNFSCGIEITLYEGVALFLLLCLWTAARVNIRYNECQVELGRVQLAREGDIRVAGQRAARGKAKAAPRPGLNFGLGN